MNPRALRIGYVPYSTSLEAPGDRRRFAHYARARKLQFELAQPEKQYDLVVLSEAADVTVWGCYPHGKVVYDLIDSFLAIPRTNVKHWLRGPLWYALGRHRMLRLDFWAAIRDMCRRADAVVCTTEEQQRDIKRHCSNVHIILDMHNSVVGQPKDNYRCSTPFNLVWEGLPSNLTQLRQIRDVLREINEHSPLALHVVTDPDQPRFLGRFGRVHTIDLVRNIFDNVHFHVWSEATCAAVVRDCDLAVIPIDLSDPFVTGKPENKLLLLWRMGIPAVTSATPAYERTILEIGLNGLACRDQREWRLALESMISSEEQRREAGMRGRVYAETHFSEKTMLARWDAVFESIGFRFVNGMPLDC